MFDISNLIGIPAAILTGLVTVYIIVVPLVDSEPAPIPLRSIIDTEPTLNPVGNAIVILFIVPVVAVVNSIS